MKIITKKLFAAVLVASLSLSFPASVHATETQEATSQPANRANFSVSSRSLNVGDTLRVRVWANSPTTLSLTYNNIILEYDSCTASVTKDGNTVSFTGAEATFTFKAKSAGQAGLIVSGEGVSRASANVMVSETAQEEQQDTPEETTEPSDDAATTTEEPTSDEGSDGDESESGEVTTTIGSAKRYVSVMDPPELPDGVLSEAVIELGSGVTINGYQLIGGGNEFYYVYGIDEEENLGWFMYDATEKTLSRIDSALIFRSASSDEPKDVEKEPKEDLLTRLKGMFSDMRVVIAACILLLALLLAIIINIIAGRRDDDDDEDYDDEEEEKVKVPVSPVRSGREEAPEPELEPISIDDLPEVSEGVWDEEEEKHESPEPDKSIANHIDMGLDHSLIGQKHVDIMDLNDL